ncbi:flagellar export chaperone FliS [Pseudactinotalea terrae]|uniref:flagellar export chaperone FliS n=1 Tax=Pseudactinotalea terrae TaxID=1743262 RepID=UPI0012E10C8B|nr:flagellar export chaperone FliS [Pseudactinotalea terrae]
MSTLTNARASYLADQVMSASPPRLLTMLYDRLLLDLARAAKAQADQDWPAASAQLIHAQQIVTELMTSLDLDAWDGAQNLHAIYAYALTQLVEANTGRDRAITSALIEILEPLRQTWHEAAQLASAGAPGSAPTGALGIG